MIMNSARIKECTDLSAEILKNFELSEIPVSNIILKCLRLCRLMGDEDGILLFSYESSGYPYKSSGGMTSDAWRISQIAGRRYNKIEKDSNGKQQQKEYVYPALISQVEESITSEKIRLSAATDPGISLSSANPNQYLQPPSGNARERSTSVGFILEQRKWLSKITGNLYNYVLKIYNKLSYGNVVEDTFTQARLQTNEVLGELCPNAIQKFVSAYDNMDSDNPEDWANAVHSCRRILVDLADALYPPRQEPVVVNGKEIKVGQDQYINRLVQFIASKSGSKTYKDVVGADLSSMGNRLDAINDAVCKGTHTDITKDEASRYIIHTYLLVSDIVALMD